MKNPFWLKLIALLFLLTALTLLAFMVRYQSAQQDKRTQGYDRSTRKEAICLERTSEHSIPLAAFCREEAVQRPGLLLLLLV